MMRYIHWDVSILNLNAIYEICKKLERIKRSILLMFPGADQRNMTKEVVGEKHGWDSDSTFVSTEAWKHYQDTIQTEVVSLNQQLQISYQCLIMICC